MRWLSFADEREKRLKRWHPWYAWFPVRISGPDTAYDGPYVWLEWVWRRKDYGFMFRYEIETPEGVKSNA